MTVSDKQKAILEALLFVWEQPLELEKIARVLDVSNAEAESVLAALEEDLEASNRGLTLCKVEGKYRLGTRPDLAPFIEKIFPQETTGQLSNPALETLAIIAYRQPITKTEIEAIRGVGVDGVLDNLVRRKLVQVVGRKEVPGKPHLYGTTPEFLKYFGLKSLDELPPLKQDDGLSAQ